MRKILPLLAVLAATTAVPAPALAQAAGEDSAVRDPDCDRQCLLAALAQHMDALRAGDATAAGFAPNAVFTENNVVIEPGEGLWKTVTAVDAEGLEAADPSTGNAAWFGSSWPRIKKHPRRERHDRQGAFSALIAANNPAPNTLHLPHVSEIFDVHLLFSVEN